MTTVSVSTSLKSWHRKFTGQKRQLNLFTAAQLQTNRGMLFIHSGSYNGHETWKPLRLRDGQPLRDKGTLQKSIGPMNRSGNGMVPAYNEGSVVRISGDQVTVGTNLKYAELMNKGGTILPKNGKLLWIPLPENRKSQAGEVKAAIKTHKKKGKANLGGAPIVRLKNGKYFMLAKKVVIPPRPFDKLNSQDREEIRTALANEVARVLNQRG